MQDVLGLVRAVEFEREASHQVADFRAEPVFADHGHDLIAGLDLVFGIPEPQELGVIGHEGDVRQREMRGEGFGELGFVVFPEAGRRPVPGGGQQQELFDALKALGKPIVVVLTNGRPLSTVKVADEANALVESWYLGQATGTGLASMLFGETNPGGKLPVTIPRTVGQIPIYYNYKPSAHRGYLFTDADPLFPFGWGLSYSAFSLSKPRLSQANIGTEGTVTVSVDITNSGKRAGDEVVQLYIRDKESSVTQPVKALKGFQRVTLNAGERRTVNFTLTPEALSLWNSDMKRVVEPGEFEIMTGTNSVDLQSTTLTVTG